jgi:hypothetical protein
MKLSQEAKHAKRYQVEEAREWLIRTGNQP